MAGRFDGRVALITGGASGIGRATALALATEGATVAIADLDQSGGEDVVRTITEAGRNGLFVKTDVAVAAEVKALVARVVDTFGRLDAAFNSAGLLGAPSARTAECTEQNWDRVITTNLKGTWLCLKYEIRQMATQGGGAIVNAASAAALSGSFVSAPYTVSKQGILGLTRTAAVENAAKGIRINAVCPGYIRTPMLEKLLRLAPGLEQRLTDREPIGRLGQPEDVAAAVLWLLSDEAGFVTGHALGVDGGLGAA